MRNQKEVTRRTLYRWKKELDTAHGKLTALDQKSTVPKKRRQRKRITSTKQGVKIKGKYSFERFNRTISEGFIMRNRMLLTIDINAFNEKLID